MCDLTVFSLRWILPAISLFERPSVIRCRISRWLLLSGGGSWAELVGSSRNAATLRSHGLAAGEYLLLTAHRAGDVRDVDDPDDEDGQQERPRFQLDRADREASRQQHRREADRKQVDGERPDDVKQPGEHAVHEAAEEAGDQPDDRREHAGEERGRDPDKLQINGFVGPGEDGVSLDDLKFYKEAGVHRVILFSQRDAVRMAAGRTLEIVRKLAPIVERAQHA